MFYKNIYLLFLFCLFVFCGDKNNRKSSPNIIVFMVDDLGWQDTSLPFWTQTTKYNKLYETPNMERLAKQGMKFTQAYATPVCSPSRVSLMTGMNAARHRVTNWTLERNALQPMEVNHKLLKFPRWNVNGISPRGQTQLAAHATCLPKLLQSVGYKTIHVGKAHFGAIGTPAAEPKNIGFDINIAGHAAGGIASFLGEENFGNISKYKSNKHKVPGLEKYHSKDIFITEALTREAINTLKKMNHAKQSFFLYMSHYAVHSPITADKRFMDKYIKKGMDTIEARYATMVEGVDKSLGDIMDYLENNDLSKNTIIIFMSDNGGLSAAARAGERHTHNKPLSSGKGSIYEGGIRVPMIVKWHETIKPNTKNDNYLIIEDFFPTILEMAGVDNYKVPQTLDGISFVNMLLNPSKKLNYHRPIFWHYPNDWGVKGPGIGAFSAIRKGDWKLIYYHKDQSYELFNIKDDIGEKNNLTHSHPDKMIDLSNTLTHYLIDVKAQMPTHRSSGKRVDYP